MTDAQKPAEHLRVVSGNPSAEELAVVVAVIQAAASAAANSAASSQAARLANWHKNPGVLRGQVIPGHGQWVASVRRGLH
ncbi:MAG: acyl-CoA carboxylase epsilon subunit [Micrococcales bacterium]